MHGSRLLVSFAPLRTSTSYAFCWKSSPSVLYSDLNLAPGRWFKVDSPGGALLNYPQSCATSRTNYLLDRLYGAMIPSALNVFTCQAYLILNSIIGGQALAAASQNLDDTLGIVIIGVVSVVVCFCGFFGFRWLNVAVCRWLSADIGFYIGEGISSDAAL